jgi:hypothetical protein
MIRVKLLGKEETKDKISALAKKLGKEFVQNILESGSNLDVGGSGTAKISREFLNITAKIVSLSNVGEIEVEFNEFLKLPSNISQQFKLDVEANLTLNYIIIEEWEGKQGYEFWVEDIKPTILVLRIKWDNPLYISQNAELRDKLSITFRNTSWIKSVKENVDSSMITNFTTNEFSINKQMREAD